MVHYLFAYQINSTTKLNYQYYQAKNQQHMQPIVIPENPNLFTDAFIANYIVKFLDIKDFKTIENGKGMLEMIRKYPDHERIKLIIRKVISIFSCDDVVGRVCSLQFLKEGVQTGSLYLIENIQKSVLHKFSDIVEYRSHIKSIQRGSTYFVKQMDKNITDEQFINLVKYSSTFFRMVHQCIYVWGHFYFPQTNFQRFKTKLQNKIEFPKFPQQFKFFNQTKINNYKSIHKDIIVKLQQKYKNAQKSNHSKSPKHHQQGSKSKIVKKESFIEARNPVTKERQIKSKFLQEQDKELKNELNNLMPISSRSSKSKRHHNKKKSTNKLQKGETTRNQNKIDNQNAIQPNQIVNLSKSLDKQQKQSLSQKNQSKISLKNSFTQIPLEEYDQFKKQANQKGKVNIDDRKIIDRLDIESKGKNKKQNNGKFVTISQISESDGGRYSFRQSQNQEELSRSQTFYQYQDRRQTSSPRTQYSIIKKGMKVIQLKKMQSEQLKQVQKRKVQTQMQIKIDSRVKQGNQLPKTTTNIIKNNKIYTKQKNQAPFADVAVIKQNIKNAQYRQQQTSRSRKQQQRKAQITRKKFVSSQQQNSKKDTTNNNAYIPLQNKTPQSFKNMPRIDKNLMKNESFNSNLQEQINLQVKHNDKAIPNNKQYKPKEIKLISQEKQAQRNKMEIAKSNDKIKQKVRQQQTSLNKIIKPQKIKSTKEIKKQSKLVPNELHSLQRDVEQQNKRQSFVPYDIRQIKFIEKPQKKQPQVIHKKQKISIYDAVEIQDIHQVRLDIQQKNQGQRQIDKKAFNKNASQNQIKTKDQRKGKIQIESKQSKQQPNLQKSSFQKYRMSEQQGKQKGQNINNIKEMQFIQKINKKITNKTVSQRQSVCQQTIQNSMRQIKNNAPQFLNRRFRNFKQISISIEPSNRNIQKSEEKNKMDIKQIQQTIRQQLMKEFDALKNIMLQTNQQNINHTISQIRQGLAAGENKGREEIGVQCSTQTIIKHKSKSKIQRNNRYKSFVQNERKNSENLDTKELISLNRPIQEARVQQSKGLAQPQQRKSSLSKKKSLKKQNEQFAPNTLLYALYKRKAVNL